MEVAILVEALKRTSGGCGCSCGLGHPPPRASRWLRLMDLYFISRWDNILPWNPARARRVEVGCNGTGSGRGCRRPPPARSTCTRWAPCDYVRKSQLAPKCKIDGFLLRWSSSRHLSCSEKRVNSSGLLLFLRLFRCHVSLRCPDYIVLMLTLSFN